MADEDKRSSSSSGSRSRSSGGGGGGGGGSLGRSCDFLRSKHASTGAEESLVVDESQRCPDVVYVHLHACLSGLILSDELGYAFATLRGFAKGTITQRLASSQ